MDRVLKHPAPQATANHSQLNTIIHPNWYSINTLL
jgi:hypothetical protein